MCQHFCSNKVVYVSAVNQDGLPAILNISPIVTNVQENINQLGQQGSTLAGDILHQGTALPAGVSLIKDQLKSVINIARKLVIVS